MSTLPDPTFGPGLFARSPPRPERAAEAGTEISQTSWYHLSVQEPHPNRGFSLPPVVEILRSAAVMVTVGIARRAAQGWRIAAGTAGVFHAEPSGTWVRFLGSTVMRASFGVGAVLTLGASLTLLASRPAPAGAGGGGTIVASVTYAGAPAVEKIAVNRDTERCGRAAVIDRVAVGPNKGLAHAVVSVVGATGEAPAKKASIDQTGCRFWPRVVAMMPGELEIRNSDDILHNIHTHSTANPPINQALPKFKKTMMEKFEKPEIIKLTCDVHSWMVAWIVVMPHPFFAVTDDAGVATIENVPPGKHTLEVWHEALGRATEQVEVTAGRVTKVAVEMKE